MAKQLEQLLDVLVVLHSVWQCCIEFDWTRSGKAAPRLGALSAHCMDVTYGGKQSIPKAFTIAAYCLGPISSTFKVGGMQDLCYRSGGDSCCT